MKSIIVSAKSIEKAIEEGLAILNVGFEDVDVVVLNEGSLFKKAKVELIVNETVTETREEKIKNLENKQKQQQKPQTQKTEPAKEQVKPQVHEPKKEVKPENVVKQKQQIEDKEEVELKQKLETIEKELQEISKNETQDKPNLDQKIEEEIKSYLNGLIYAYNILAGVEVETTNKDINVRIVGENLGVLIGYHGQALESIQYLLNNHLYNKFGRTKKVSLDIENYRKKRLDSLQNMSESLAQKVLKTKKSFKLEPMSSYERKIIHSHLQNFENIKTHSEGKEPKRFLVISYID